MAVHVRYNSWYISFLSAAKQQCDMIKKSYIVVENVNKISWHGCQTAKHKRPFIQFSAIEIRSVFSHTKLFIS